MVGCAANNNKNKNKYYIIIHYSLYIFNLQTQSFFVKTITYLKLRDIYQEFGFLSQRRRPQSCPPVQHKVCTL